MADVGVAVDRFRPTMRWKCWEADHRTHRKVLVVDDRAGFTGGVGMASEWEGDARGPSEWCDTHFQIEGAPAVLASPSSRRSSPIGVTPATPIDLSDARVTGPRVSGTRRGEQPRDVGHLRPCQQLPRSGSPGRSRSPLTAARRAEQNSVVSSYLE